MTDVHFDASRSATRLVKPVSTRPTSASAMKLTIRIPPAAKAGASRTTGNATKKVAPTVSKRNRKIASNKRVRQVQKEDLMVSDIYNIQFLVNTHEEIQDNGKIITKNGEPRWACGVCQKDIVPMRRDVGKHWRSHDPK